MIKADDDGNDNDNDDDDGDDDDDDDDDDHDDHEEGLARASSCCSGARVLVSNDILHVVQPDLPHALSLAGPGSLLPVPRTLGQPP